MLSYVLLGFTYAFAAAAQPGQFQAYIISQALTVGWRRTLPAALAPILSDIPVVTLVLLVLTRVPALFVSTLQFAGGLFVLYLAARAAMTWRHYRMSSAASSGAAHQTVLRAAAVNLLNPNPYIAWALILGPLLLRAWRQAPAIGVAFLATFYLTIVAGTAGIILLFSAARSFGPGVARSLVGLSAAALGGFGLYQVWSGGSTLLQHLH